jgi:hypothetical protein
LLRFRTTSFDCSNDAKTIGWPLDLETYLTEWLAAADSTTERVHLAGHPRAGHPLVEAHSQLAVLSEVVVSHREAPSAVAVVGGPIQGFPFHSPAFTTGRINCGESKPFKETGGIVLKAYYTLAWD